MSSAATKPSEKWFLCQADNDCVHIDYYCAGAVVNKAFVREANEYYGWLNASRNCERSEPLKEQKKIPYKVFCESKRCKVQGINPKKPGFS